MPIVYKIKECSEHAWGDWQLHGPGGGKALQLCLNCRKARTRAEYFKAKPKMLAMPLRSKKKTAESHISLWSFD